MGVEGVAAHCQDVVTYALKDRLGRTPNGKAGSISWIDDIIIGHETLEGLMEDVIVRGPTPQCGVGPGTITIAVGLVLNPDKFIFFA